MERAKLLAAAATLIAFALLFAFSFNFFGSPGLFLLFSKKESKPAEITEAVEENKGIKAGLSFALLEPTTIEASILKGQHLSQCPTETETEISVKNTGSAVAEKVFLRFGLGIKAIACSNCSVDELKPLQETKAKALLCLDSNHLQHLTVGSANSNRVEIKLE